MMEKFEGDDGPRASRRQAGLARLARDLAADWTRWSRSERFAATLFATLMSTAVPACYAWTILHPLR